MKQNLFKKMRVREIMVRIFRSDLIFVILLIIIFILFFKNFLFNRLVGAPDWHYVMLYIHITKETIQDFHQFPHWVLGYYKFWYPRFYTYEFFAIPETPVLTLFLPFYFMDIYTSIKLIIALHIALGIVGIYFLGKSFGINRIGMLFIASIFFLTPRFVSHLSIGHIGWLTLAYLPYIFLFFNKSIERPNFLIFASFLSTFVILEGGQHIFIWISLLLGIYSLFIFIEKRKITVLRNLLFFYILEILLSAIKIFPMFHFFKDYKIAGITPEYTIQTLWHALTTAFLNHDQGNYIGILTVIIFLTVIIYGIKKHPSLTLTALFFFLLSTKLWKISLFQVISKLPILYTQRIAPRYLTICFFLLSIVAGFLFTDIVKIAQRRSSFIKSVIYVLLLGIVVYISFDLHSKAQIWHAWLWKYHFHLNPVEFKYYTPSLLPSGKLEIKLAQPNVRIWKAVLKQDSKVLFKELEFKLYKDVLKFEVLLQGRYQRIFPQDDNGSIALLIPKDARSLIMKYSSPYFCIGFIVSFFSALSILLYFGIRIVRRSQRYF